MSLEKITICLVSQGLTSAFFIWVIMFLLLAVISPFAWSFWETSLQRSLCRFSP